jgi:hypothetical protein
MVNPRGEKKEFETFLNKKPGINPGLSHNN